MFGPNQVGELMIGNAAASQTTAQTFVASANDKELAVVASTGAAVAVNVPFKVLQKTAGDASRNLNFEFSDIVEPKYVERVTVSAYLAETQKSVTVAGFTGNVVADTTYGVEIKLLSDLSPENFEIIHGYYVTGASVVGVTDVMIRDGVLSSLRKTLLKRGDSEFILKLCFQSTIFHNK